MGGGAALESWDDLTYTVKSESGPKQIKIPQALKQFKEWVENQKDTKSINIKKKTSTLHFNPALEGNNISSVIGDKYKGLDCSYMIPVFEFRFNKERRQGNTIYIYEVKMIAVLYAEEGHSKYGKVGFFQVDDKHKGFNHVSLKDSWGFFKWFQPSFDTDCGKLISQFNTIIDKIIAVYEKVKDKLSSIMKPKSEKDATDSSE